jgi:hypothetical protein
MAAVVRTTAIIVSTDTEYGVPGDLTPAQFIAAYSSRINGLSSMAFEEVIANVEGVGNVRTITFSPKKGTKG